MIFAHFNISLINYSLLYATVFIYINFVNYKSKTFLTRLIAFSNSFAKNLCFYKNLQYVKRFNFNVIRNKKIAKSVANSKTRFDI